MISAEGPMSPPTVQKLLFFIFKILFNAIVSTEEQLSPPRSITKSLEHFDRFSDLPNELQAMIWEFATLNENPRLLQFFTWENKATHTMDLKVRSKMPAVLHVNSQARKWAEEHYKKFSEMEIFLNPNNDAVFMKDASVPRIIPYWIEHLRKQGIPHTTEVEEKVKFLAVGGTEEYPSIRSLEDCGYSNLEQIVLEKQDGDITSEQEEYLSQSAWRRKPTESPSKEWHYVNIFPQSKPKELSFLTEKQMNEDVRPLSLPFCLLNIADEGRTIDSSAGIWSQNRRIGHFLCPETWLKRISFCRASNP